LCLFFGMLLQFWKKSASAKYLVNELAVLPLVILLISPESFRHHYLLAAFPLLYLWVKSRGRATEWSSVHWTALALSSLIIGTVFTDYIITGVRNPLLDLFLTSLVSNRHNRVDLSCYHSAINRNRVPRYGISVGVSAGSIIRWCRDSGLGPTLRAGIVQHDPNQGRSSKRALSQLDPFYHRS